MESEQILSKDKFSIYESIYNIVEQIIDFKKSSDDEKNKYFVPKKNNGCSLQL